MPSKNRKKVIPLSVGMTFCINGFISLIRAIPVCDYVFAQLIFVKTLTNGFDDYLDKQHITSLLAVFTTSDTTFCIAVLLKSGVSSCIVFSTAESLLAIFTQRLYFSCSSCWTVTMQTAALAFTHYIKIWTSKARSSLRLLIDYPRYATYSIILKPLNFDMM